MKPMTPEATTPQTPSSAPRVSRTLLAGGLIFFILLSAGATFAFYSVSYTDRAFPGTHMGGIDVGGMSEEEIEVALYARYTSMINKDLTLTHKGVTKTVHLEVSSDPELSFELISLNVDQSAKEAVRFGHEGPWYTQVARRITAPFTKPALAPSLTINGIVLGDIVRETFSSIENPGSPTDFVFDSAFTSATIEPGTRGTEIDIRTFFRDLEGDAMDLSLNPIELKIIDSPEPLSTSEASTVVNSALTQLGNTPITLTYTSDTERVSTFEISKELLADALVPARVSIKERESTQLGLSLEESVLNPLFLEIEQKINVAPTDARFKIENGKVVEFAGSTQGVTFDKDATLTTLTDALNTVRETPGSYTVTISAKTTEPDIQTGEVNDLGITEVLGTGWSGWKGSPPNRIKNIRHATQKLNGLLIAPGEQISLTSKLGPLTLEDGYLPEMVIAGDEIKPEIAGGLCQIGTTVFRAAMNAGLQIDQRRNHSLVVSYYNDPSNGNPGTDATLYEPVLDLKFTNTTGKHILLTTEFNEAGQELIYTFWGTSDGRKAYYTPPKVLSRTAPGPMVIKPTTTLAPGQRKCQNAYTGASTTFDYIIEMPDGTVKTQTFDSYYRALPQICLEGVDPNAPTPEEPTLPGEEVTDPAATPLGDAPIIAEPV